MNRTRVVAMGFGLCIIGIAIFAFTFLRSVADPKPPFCENNLTGSLEEWVMEQEAKGDRTRTYPNVAGDGRKSMEVFGTLMPRHDVLKMYQDYAYVPGLRESDPPSLILMYLKQPTRYKWHGDKPGFLRKRNWLVFAPGFANADGESSEWCPENGRWISASEFRKRLEITLSFLQKQNRPNWERVAQEHRAFLETFKD